MVGRRHARVKRKVYRWSDIGVDSSSDEDANVQVPEASTSGVRGKQKVATKRSSVRVTKKGKLGMIAEMPLDVLYEVRAFFRSERSGLHVLRPQVFYFLAPRDLVRMSWTSKHFRGVLTSRSTRNIWRAALQTIEGLPPCPPYMNEIEYSTVLFHVGCYVCPFVLATAFLRVYGEVGVREGATSGELALSKEDLQTMLAGSASPLIGLRL
jgi:hypothetical protein